MSLIKLAIAMGTPSMQGPLFAGANSYPWSQQFQLKPQMNPQTPAPQTPHGAPATVEGVQQKAQQQNMAMQTPQPPAGMVDPNQQVAQQGAMEQGKNLIAADLYTERLAKLYARRPDLAPDYDPLTDPEVSPQKSTKGASGNITPELTEELCQAKAAMMQLDPWFGGESADLQKLAEDTCEGTEVVSGKGTDAGSERDSGRSGGPKKASTPTQEMSQVTVIGSRFAKQSGQDNAAPSRSSVGESSLWVNDAGPQRFGADAWNSINTHLRSTAQGQANPFRGQHQPK